LTRSDKRRKHARGRTIGRILMRDNSRGRSGFRVRFIDTG